LFLHVAFHCSFLFNFCLQELGDSQSAYALRDFFDLNASFGNEITFTDVAKLVRFLDEEWGMLSFTDLVLNHAANESKWIAENPQCVYNLVNTPHLKPAFLLDCLLARFSKEIADGLWMDVGLPPKVRTENHLQLIQHFLKERIEKLRLWEFYQVTVMICMILLYCCLIIFNNKCFMNGKTDNQYWVTWHCRF